MLKRCTLKAFWPLQGLVFSFSGGAIYVRHCRIVKYALKCLMSFKLREDYWIIKEEKNKLVSCRSQACSSGKPCMNCKVSDFFPFLPLKFQTSTTAVTLENRGEMKLALQYVPHPVGGMHCCFGFVRPLRELFSFFFPCIFLFCCGFFVCLLFVYF